MSLRAPAAASKKADSFFGNAKPLARAVQARPAVAATRKVTSMNVLSGFAAGEVPTMQKRNIMNLILAGGLALPTLGMLGPYVYFFVPAGSGGASAGLVAKDALGDDVTEKGWLATHQAGDYSLVQGLKGDATYLVVKPDTGKIADFGINAVCTHLGCVVPWNSNEKKFMCPCHGSQYDSNGKVVRGPAPLSLALAHADIVEGKVVLSTWSETDFRTGLEPWWS